MGLQQRVTAHDGVLPKGLRILVVEDQPLVAMLLEDMIAQIDGVVVAVAPSVEAGLAACAALSFAVALVDIDLAGQPSTPVVQELAARGIPFVITSGTEVPLFGFETAPRIAKPFTRKALERVLAEVVSTS